MAVAHTAVHDVKEAPDMVTVEDPAIYIPPPFIMRCIEQGVGGRVVSR